MSSALLIALIYGLPVYMIGVWAKDKLVLTLATISAAIVSVAMTLGAGEKLPQTYDLMVNGEPVQLIANIYAALVAFVLGLVWISIRRNSFRSAGKAYFGHGQSSRKTSWVVLFACVAAFGAVGYDTYMHPPATATTVTPTAAPEPEAPAPQPEKRARAQAPLSSSAAARHKRSDLDLRQCLEAASNADIVKCAN